MLSLSHSLSFDQLEVNPRAVTLPAVVYILFIVCTRVCDSCTSVAPRVVFCNFLYWCRTNDTKDPRECRDATKITATHVRERYPRALSIMIQRLTRSVILHLQ